MDMTKYNTEREAAVAAAAAEQLRAIQKDAPDVDPARAQALARARAEAAYDSVNHPSLVERHGASEKLNELMKAGGGQRFLPGTDIQIVRQDAAPAKSDAERWLAYWTRRVEIEAKMAADEAAG